jgi:pimeloyl-ACP methyl ester carboxylesterase
MALVKKIGKKEIFMPDVVVRGTKINFLESRSKNGRRNFPIIFIHGSGGNAGMWGKVMEGLVEEWSSMAVNLPGHGASQGEGMKSVRDYSDFMNKFCEALGVESFVLGGHSMGGAIGLDFAIHYPQKLRALLLVGAGARLRVLPEALEVSRKMAFGEIPPKFFPFGFADIASPEVIAEGEREWARTNSLVRYNDFLACDRFDLMGDAEKIHLPTLVVCGREDRLTPVKYSEFLNKKIAGSRLEVLDGAGHMVMLEAPRAMSGAIRTFLSSL